MADEEDDKTVRYHRRLDRTPEKQFERLPDAEKKLMSAMRGALENCKNRVEGMKDELAEKEKTIEEERSRREEAEERLKRYLVNPYKSPDVNSELRNRLPRSSKRDPLVGRNDSQSSDEAEILEQKTSEAGSPKRTPKGFKASGGKSPNKRKVRHSINFNSPPAAHTRHDQKEADRDDNNVISTSEDEEEEHHRGRRNGREKRRNSYTHSGLPPLYSPHHSPIYSPGGVGYQFASPYYRSLSVTPFSSMTSFQSLPSSLYMHSPREGQATPLRARIPQSRSFPLMSEDLGDLYTSGNATAKPEGEGDHQDHMTSAVHAGLQSGAAVNQTGTAASQQRPDQPTTKPSDTAHGNQPTSDRTTVNQSASTHPAPGSTYPTGLQSQSASSMSSSHYYPLPTALGPGFGREGDGLGAHFRPFPPIIPPVFGDGTMTMRTEQFLHEEIDRLKVANKQLTAALSAKTQEVETLKLQLLAESPNDATLDSETARKFTELINDVKVAEKRREGTMDARIRQAEEERERASRDLENSFISLSSPNRKQRAGRHLTMSDLSESETETETESEEELEEERPQRRAFVERDNSGQVFQATNPDAGRVSSLKDALKEVEARQQRQLQIYQEELQVVLEQRDQALQQLQEERERSTMQQLRVPAQREQILMAKISALQREKDRAENLARQLKDEQTERRLYESLHKALFADSALNDSAKAAMAAQNKFHAKKVTSSDEDEGYETKRKEDNQLLEQLRQANLERSMLQMRCDELEAVCLHEKEEKNKLDRLNGVLRKKLMTVSSGERSI